MNIARERITHSYVRAIKRAGATFYLPMWDATTAVMDQIGGVAHTLSGNYTLAVPGIVGSAIRFGGTNAKITLSPGITLPTTFSLTMWIRPIAGGDSYAAIGATSTGVGLFYRSSTKLMDFYYSSADHLTTTALTESVWQHYALIVTAGAVAQYINGVAAGTSTSFTGLPTAVSLIGDDASTETYKGDLAHWAYAPVAWSPGQIQEQVNIGFGRIRERRLVFAAAAASSFVRSLVNGGLVNSGLVNGGLVKS